MKNPIEISRLVYQSYQKIHQDTMCKMPIINKSLQVQTVGFEIFDERIIGILITPWMMNFIIFPKNDENWDNVELGKKKTFEFCDKSYKFLSNEIENIGACFTHSLCSPMNQFSNQQQAESFAYDFLKNLKITSENTEKEQIDEDLLGKILKGEPTPDINLDDFETIKSMANTDNKTPKPTKKIKTKLSRRDLIHGKFTND
ncbi:MAG: hypothetical protein DRQ51_07380 [Gammaproteobacteria bacterium]|nr:MAG: hypothetical protein DRQ51_07380 [Gammaproteobacteria bacterium]